jgi:hypothetical protein
LRRIHDATQTARRSYVQEVQTQQNRDVTEIAGLSKAALAVLQNVGMSGSGGERRRLPPPGEGPRRSAHRRRAGPVHAGGQPKAWTGG